MPVYEDDVGNAIKLALQDATKAPLDLSGGTVTLKFERPDGSTFARDAEITHATRGLAEYVIEEGDLDAPGTWKYQGYIELPSGEKMHTPKAELVVSPHIEVEED